MRRSTLLAVLVVLLTGACAPTVVTVVDDDRSPAAGDPALAMAGLQRVEVATATLRSAAGCTLRYEVHTPVGSGADLTVVIAHGFLRDLSTMRGWAEHLAGHGLRSAVVSLCRSTPFAGRHAGNAEDLRAVADALLAREPGRTTGSVAYAGFSAGGLSALLAAADDPRAVAYLGLDPVDGGGLAARAAGWDGPALFLFAEPSRCNADGSMVPMVNRLPAATAIAVPHATHCHFEDPYAPLCERLCGRVEPEEAARAIRDAVRSQATAFLLAQAGTRP